MIEEIAELEAKLAAKKMELANAGTEAPEKDVFRQVIKEHATGEKMGSNMAMNITPAQTTPAATTVSPAVTAQLNTYLSHAFTKGIADAVKEAKKTGDAYFVDLLHDKLADEYYQKLLQARKINPS